MAEAAAENGAPLLPEDYSDGPVASDVLLHTDEEPLVGALLATTWHHVYHLRCLNSHIGSCSVGAEVAHSHSLLLVNVDGFAGVCPVETCGGGVSLHSWQDFAMGVYGCFLNLTSIIMYVATCVNNHQQDRHKKPMLMQVVGPVSESPEDGSTARADLLGFLTDGASMLIRSSLLQVCHLCRAYKLSFSATFIVHHHVAMLTYIPGCMKWKTHNHMLLKLLSRPHDPSPGHGERH